MSTMMEGHHTHPEEAAVAHEPLPPAVLASIGAFALLTLVGAGLWALWLTSLSAEQVADTTWFFLCHLSVGR